jgi:hypothetical protein
MDATALAPPCGNPTSAGGDGTGIPAARAAARDPPDAPRATPRRPPRPACDPRAGSGRSGQDGSRGPMGESAHPSVRLVVDRCHPRRRHRPGPAPGRGGGTALAGRRRRRSIHCRRWRRLHGALGRPRRGDQTPRFEHRPGPGRCASPACPSGAARPRAVGRASTWRRSGCAHLPIETTSRAGARPTAGRPGGDHARRAALRARGDRHAGLDLDRPASRCCGSRARDAGLGCGAATAGTGELRPRRVVTGAARVRRHRQRVHPGGTDRCRFVRCALIPRGELLVAVDHRRTVHDTRRQQERSASADPARHRGASDPARRQPPRRVPLSAPPDSRPPGGVPQA